ncbi:hypothetical protein [Xanthocytophaga agilis]|uniref:Uncharacterized protein n=1 Tax=Xanthocytophaga agilis TaxID=3048010 RepID=A0AAE3RAA0_9BACT|nr:hypothetical protein [Xanthocytophaga agilis]MDJ1506075.1 hypothetical protein [Xanthocytophaga agilis]
MNKPVETVTLQTLELGGIYKTIYDSRPYRVLAFDEIEVLCDCSNTSLSYWKFVNPRARYYYYRMPTALFLDNVTFLKSQPLSETESNMYMPQLPLRACRHPTWTWTSETYSFNDILNHPALLDVKEAKTLVLPVPEIVIYPYGPKRGLRKPVTVQALDNKGFSWIELLWQAHLVQAAHIHQPQSPGVGIYRLGSEKRKASYYIEGYYDRAGFIPKE